MHEQTSRVLEASAKKIRELKLTPLKTSREGLLSQPIWGNMIHPGPKINPTWAKLWSKLECNAIYNVYSDYDATTLYSKEAHTSKWSFPTQYRISSTRLPAGKRAKAPRY